MDLFIKHPTDIIKQNDINISMKLHEFIDAPSLDRNTPSPYSLAVKYGVPLSDIYNRLDVGIRVELEHTTDEKVAKEIALDHLGERLDYYEKLASSVEKQGVTGDEIREDGDWVSYPGKGSGKLRDYVRRKYGGDMGCKKASMIINDPDATKFYKRRAVWYRNLHCRGNKQIREEDPAEVPNAALTIWDIDDTLFKTSAKVLVNCADGSRKALTSSEFNGYVPKVGETFDFSQFDDANLFHSTSEPIDQIWKTALNTLENIGKRPGSRMVIITARRDLDDKHRFIDTFRKHGMDMSKVHVFRAGNLNHGSSAANKQAIVRDLLELGNYSETRMFDDHLENLQAFLELKNEFPDITFKAFPVKSDGSVGRSVIV